MIRLGQVILQLFHKSGPAFSSSYQLPGIVLLEFDSFYKHLKEHYSPILDKKQSYKGEEKRLTNLIGMY